jgi:hypothetical protein
MTTLEVSYTVPVFFDIPEGVVLLPPAVNERAPVGTPFTWWIKYKTLHYIDYNCKEQTVDGDDAIDFKRHDENTETLFANNNITIWRNNK